MGMEEFNSDDYYIYYYRQEEYNQSDFSVYLLVMSMCRVFSCVFEEGVCYDQCIFLANLY